MMYINIYINDVLQCLTKNDKQAQFLSYRLSLLLSGLRL